MLKSYMKVPKSFVFSSMKNLHFGSKMATFSARIIQKYTKFANFAKFIFRIFQRFATRFYTSTQFKIFFLAVVKDFVDH